MSTNTVNIRLRSLCIDVETFRNSTASLRKATASCSWIHTTFRAFLVLWVALPLNKCGLPENLRRKAMKFRESAVNASPLPITFRECAKTFGSIPVMFVIIPATFVLLLKSTTARPKTFGILSTTFTSMLGLCARYIGLSIDQAHNCEIIDGKLNRNKSNQALFLQ